LTGDALIAKAATTRVPAWPPLEQHRKRAMSTFHDAAYTMSAVSATVALFRALVKKGVLTREEAVRAILDEAVGRAIQAEAQPQGQPGNPTDDINRQSAEILKFIAEKL
jgi:hypothetical protein